MTHSKKELLSPLSNKIRLISVVAILSILGSASSLILIASSPSYSPLVVMSFTEASFGYSGWPIWVVGLIALWLALTLIESIFIVKSAHLLWSPITKSVAIVGRINTALDYVRSGTPWVGLQSVISVLAGPVLISLDLHFGLNGLGFVGLIALACSILGLLVWSWFREMIMARSRIGEIMSAIH
jgi:hypothetical protein